MITGRLKDMPDCEKPYEKCLENGPEALSDTELLAVLLKTGTSKKDVLSVADGLLHFNDNDQGLLGLLGMSIEQLSDCYGIGRVKAIQLSCVFEISRRIWRNSCRKRIRLSDPGSVADYYKEHIRHCDVEQVHIMLFDVKNTFLRSILISQGTLCSSAVSPREIFKEVLRYKAAAFVLIHNHPSGDAEPSKEDIYFSSLLYKSGLLMNVTLYDSIIIGDNSYVSFRENDLFNLDIDLTGN